ncbi:YopX family protein [Nostoc linckia]|uniref:YopX family protein n=1 Tax=Nostoc linckia TaxID=92942 RepID=UPI000BFFFC2E|nr:YopX family protein [Nostoc linckia]
MNRELKFRAWNGEEMVSPDFIDRLGRANWKENSVPEITDRVMQFTEINDKNGVEIYERDIVSMHNPTGIPYVGVVMFGEFCVYTTDWGQGIYATGWYFQYKNEHKGRADDMALDNTVEVIGNLYEHSHLLK